MLRLTMLQRLTFYLIKSVNMLEQKNVLNKEQYKLDSTEHFHGIFKYTHIVEQYCKISEII